MNMRTSLHSRHSPKTSQPFRFQTCALAAVVILVFLASHAVFAHQQTGADFSAELLDTELFPYPLHTLESYPGKYKSLLESLAADNAARQKEDCPPCFNCLLPVFECTHFSNCSEYDGKCSCPAGFGGDDCSQPLCGALSDGRNRKSRVGDHCDCPDGWSGINCNVCEANDVCNPMVVTGQNATCYKGGLAVVENHQMCDVTNKKILDTLPADQKPQVTFSCNRGDSTCDFQFWTGERESFYCTLDSCGFEQEQSFDRNVTRYACPHITCKCVPGELLCGGGDGLDLTDFFDCIDPDQCLQGPARFQCDEVDNSGARGAIECIFDEPAMDDLIMGAFGDPYIFLSCNSGECLHYTQIPGFTRPERPDNTLLVIISIASVCIFVLAISSGLFYFARKKSAGGAIRIGDDEADTLMVNHIPATVMFKDIQYTIRKKTILHDVTGVVAPSKVMAIMGASGAGKTSLLDILARKAKTGNITGDVLINGRKVDDAEFKRIVGFVDQEDHLMATLTVYETILYSALLRLPRDMSLKAKESRVIDTMQELGILGIKDSRIGSQGKRSISGGEKRRVSIACELVTSPSILFLDEPTSGLDAYNAFNVVECLVTLAREYNRTIICTIHQPRSNIFALFDQLVLLARGYVVYSGPASGVQSYMDDIGYPCPPGFNIADYLVDLTMHALKEDDNDATNENGDSTLQGLRRQRSLGEIQNDELFTPRRRTGSDDEDVSTTEQWESELEARERNLREERLRRQQLGQVGVQVDAERDGNLEHLMDLVKNYNVSLVSRGIDQEISVALANTDEDIQLNGQNGGTGNISKSIKSYLRPTWWSQFIILSGRTFKNLYRNPMLMLTHYIISVLLAVFCGILFFNVTLDIAGFQNRMGIFFFICALFSFEALSSIQVFATERLLFVRERANEYYAPLPYFFAKIFFDLIPLRVIPAILMGIIVYPMVGLVPDTTEFLKFLLVLILFNLTSASICLAIGVIFSSPEIASLLAILLMLFSMLFGGLFLNNDSYPASLKWLKDISFFHYAFEALIVNEMRYLQLTEMKYGLQIDVPGATILTTFGFNTAAYWADTTKLGIMFLVLIGFAFIWLQAFVKDLR